MNIFEVITQERAGHLESVALIEGERQVSYGELFASVAEVASELESCGVGAAQRVGLVCHDGISYVVVSLAVLSLRAVIVPVSPSHSRAEMDTILEDMDVGFVIFEPGLLPADGSHSLSRRRMSERDLLLQRRSERRELPREYFDLNPAFIRFSSGTTGASKGVVLSHETIVERTDAANRGLGVTQDDKVIWVLSMSYHFVVSILLFLRRGASIVICSRGEFLSALSDGLARHRGTLIYASPLHYSMMTSSKAITPQMLPNVRLALSTAMRLPDADREKFAQKFHLRLVEAYGIIEVGLPCVNCSTDSEREGSVGRVLPDYEVRIVEPDAEGVGRVQVRGKGLFDAYFSPWQTRQQALAEGWFETGDLGRIDSEGFLFLCGRMKSVVNFAGMKVFPDEVESILNRYPGISESLVYGTEHGIYGELPCADIVLHNGMAAEEVDTSQIRRFCYQYLAPYKVPKEFRFVSYLEKTASGKLSRRTRASRA